MTGPGLASDQPVGLEQRHEIVDGVDHEVRSGRCKLVAGAGEPFSARVSSQGLVRFSVQAQRVPACCNADRETPGVPAFKYADRGVIDLQDGGSWPAA